MSEEFIKEVDDELKEERLAKLWKKLLPLYPDMWVSLVQ